MNLTFKRKYLPMAIFIRELIAVPLRIIIWLCSVVAIFDTVALSKLLFKLTNNIEDALSYLNLYITKNSLEAAREIAEKLLCDTRNSRVAMVMSLAENDAHNFSESRSWILKAKEGNCSDQDFLLLPELMISISTNNIDYLIVDEIISRNDLPMQFSTMAYCLKCSHLFFTGELEDAHTIATKILDIQDYYGAHFVRWVYEAKKGNSSDAQLLLKKAISSAKKIGAGDEAITSFTVYGFVLLEDFKSACDSLESVDATKVQYVLASLKGNAKVASFFETQEFKDCYNRIKGQK